MSLRGFLKNTTLADKILFSTLLILSLTGIFSIREALPKNPSAQIEVDGKPVYILPLDKDRIVSVRGPKGMTSVEIKNHKLRITESPCPNKICIENGWIEKGCLVCLPNKVVITVGGHEEKKPPVDAITG